MAGVVGQGVAGRRDGVGQTETATRVGRHLERHTVRDLHQSGVACNTRNKAHTLRGNRYIHSGEMNKTHTLTGNRYIHSGEMNKTHTLTGNRYMHSGEMNKTHTLTGNRYIHAGDINTDI